MKKINKICTLLLSTMLVGCTTQPVYINVEGAEKNIEFKGFEHICESPIHLDYDSLTKIVYIKNRTHSGFYVYTPYYAANGLPYLYNVETNTLEVNDDTY